MKKLLVFSMIFAMAVVVPCAGETVYFLVAELAPVRNESYVLPLTDPDDIEDARLLVEYGPGGPVPMIVAAAIDHWDPNRINTNRNYLQPGIPAWSWYVTEFLGFADFSAEILDGRPSGIEGNVQGWIENTGGFIGFWFYTVVAELGPDLEPWNCDLDVNGELDPNDLTLLALHWLETGCGHRYWCGGADQDGSGSVNLKDFGIFCRNWDWIDVYGKAGMSYQIDECDPGAKMAGPDKDGLRFSVTVEGNYICFEDMMKANCCPDELVLEMTVEGDLITIYETEYLTFPCLCICDWPVTATLGPFDAGTYTLEVYGNPGGFIGGTVVTIE